MDRRDVRLTLPWMGAGTEFLTRAVGALPDNALRAPSALDRWTRAHVVAHVARNAEALTRLATWARTGVESLMYTGPEQRDAAIETLARRPEAILRTEVMSTAAALDAALAALDDQAWQARVRTMRGRTIPASELPWMRIREVWLHAVDLDAGAGMADLPTEVIDLLLDDVTETLAAKDGCPAALLAPTDRNRTWALAPTADGVEVAGPASAVLGWLIGRGGGGPLAVTGGDLPAVPRWL